MKDIIEMLFCHTCGLFNQFEVGIIDNRTVKCICKCGSYHIINVYAEHACFTGKWNIGSKPKGKKPYALNAPKKLGGIIR